MCILWDRSTSTKKKRTRWNGMCYHKVFKAFQRNTRRFNEFIKLRWADNEQWICTVWNVCIRRILVTKSSKKMNKSVIFIVENILYTTYVSDCIPSSIDVPSFFSLSLYFFPAFYPCLRCFLHLWRACYPIYCAYDVSPFLFILDLLSDILFVAKIGLNAMHRNETYWE